MFRPYFYRSSFRSRLYILRTSIVPIELNIGSYFTVRSAGIQMALFLLSSVVTTKIEPDFASSITQYPT